MFRTESLVNMYQKQFTVKGVMQTEATLFMSVSLILPPPRGLSLRTLSKVVMVIRITIKYGLDILTSPHQVLSGY